MFGWYYNFYPASYFAVTVVPCVVAGLIHMILKRFAWADILFSGGILFVLLHVAVADVFVGRDIIGSNRIKNVIVKRLKRGVEIGMRDITDEKKIDELKRHLRSCVGKGYCNKKMEAVFVITVHYKNGKVRILRLLSTGLVEWRGRLYVPGYIWGSKLFE